MELILIVKIILYIVLFLLLAFFAGSETAITSLTKSEMQNSKISAFNFWIEKPEKILSTILIGSNIAMVGIGVVAVSIAKDIMVHSNKAAWSVPLVTPALVLLFGEIVPKIYSRYHADFVGKKSIGLLMWLSRYFAPINRYLIKISEMLIGRKKSDDSSFKSSSEIKHFLDASDLPVTKDTKKILANIIDFRQKRIEDVMIPRREIVAVDLNLPREQIFDNIIKSGYSRIPAYRNSLDNIVGIIYAKDLAFSYRNKDLIVIDDLIRPPYFFPQNVQVGKLLRKFKTGHFHMALIVDEHGSLTGLVTIEDIVEEIVGEIWDEYDVKESNIMKFPDGSYVIKSKESISKVNSELKINIPESEFSTIGGWSLDLFGEIPPVGSRIKWGDWDVEVIEATSRRIKKIRLKRNV
ncbi:MAG: Magnesium and cobalt efflux protein CorC [Syntrophomonadaceae bacterium]|nr:Magnesium and cobalt efflux protein CorC [Bacillota bacterium]